MWKIAIIDDDRSVLHGMKQAIPWRELDAEWAGEALNGEDGLALIRRTGPDIVLTDIYMPFMNGLDLIEALRREKFRGKVIILSGYSDFEYARHALRLQVNDYHSKPVTVQKIREVLQNAIAQLREEGAYEPYLAREWIKSVVTGTSDPQLLNDQAMSGLTLKWSRQRHRVLLLKLTNRRAAPGEFSPLADEVLLRARQRLQALLDERGLDADLVELHRHQWVLFLHLDPGAPDDTGVRLADDLAALVSTDEAGCRVGVGSVKERWEDGELSTEEAFLALAPDAAEGRGGTARRFVRPMQFYQQLVDAIRHLHEQQANESIKAFLEPSAAGGEGMDSHLRQLCLEIWGILAYSLFDVGVQLDTIFPDLDLEAEVNALSTAEQVETWLSGKVHAICADRQWSENVRHKKAVDFMLQYIEEHYAENLTLNELVNRVYISRNYLSQIFRKATGESFNQYLTKFRMNKARQMILEGDFLIYEIAEKVGFKNSPYFSTLFKKHVGFKPSEIMK